MPSYRAPAIAVAALIAAAPLAAPLSAQVTSSPEPTRHSMWLVYGGDHRFSNRVGLVLDGQLRLTMNDDRERQLLVRPGVSFALTRNVKLSAGYAISGARDDANDPLTPKRPEHRLWASAQLAHDVGRVSLAHRYRAEHRWLPGMRVDDTGAPIGEEWVSAERMRYSLRASVPLTGRARKHDVYAAASDELFASFGGYAGDIAIDQNRAGLALGVRVRPSLRVELGYTLQSSADDVGRMTQRNHVLQIGVTSSAVLR